LFTHSADDDLPGSSPKTLKALLKILGPYLDLSRIRSPLPTRPVTVDNISSEGRTKDNTLDTVRKRHAFDPVGPTWDIHDHSCAYDVWMFILFWLWYSDEERWTDILAGFGGIAKGIVDGFRSTRGENPVNSMPAMRNAWRETMRQEYPGQYPVGSVGADILELSRRMLGVAPRFSGLDTTCGSCGQETRR
jgi:hypothetical protein